MRTKKEIEEAIAKMKTPDFLVEFKRAEAAINALEWVLKKRNKVF